MFLAYRRQRSTCIGQKAPVARWISRTKAKNRNTRPRVERYAQPVDDLTANKRRVGKKNDNVAGGRLIERRLGGEHSMSRAALCILYEHPSLGNDSGSLRRHRFHSRRDNHRDLAIRDA